MLTGRKEVFVSQPRPRRKRVLVVPCVIAIVVALVIIRPWQSQQHECTVTVRPGESIQAAADAAEAGDVICLARGEWTESLVIDKSLTIVGRGAARTVIRAEWRLRPVVEVSSRDIEAIIVKLEGLTIWGDWAETGVAVNGTALAEISDCTISGMLYGIQVADSAHMVLSRSTISDSRQRAIVLSGSARASISGSQISANMAPGLWLSGSAEATISECEISGNLGHGLWLREEAQATLSNCTVSANGGHGLLLSGGATAQLLNSELSENWDQGISAEGRAQVKVIETTVLSNWHGIELRDEAQATIADSTISRNNWDGIRIRGSGQASISGSVISANGRGVGFSGNAGADFRHCRVEGNSGFGIFAWTTGEVTGEGNEFHNNGLDLGGNVPAALRIGLKERLETAVTWPDERYGSLQEAVDALLPGGKLVLEPGTYTAGLTIGTPLSIETGNGQAVLSGKSDALPVLSVVGGADLHLSGCIITGGAEGLLVSATARVVLDACTISGNTDGISVSHSAFTEIAYSDIEDNQRRGVVIAGAAQAAVSGCSVRNNGEQGFAVADSAQLTVSDSVVAGSGGDGGIVAWGSARVVLEGNTISGHRGFGVAIFQRPCFLASPWLFQGHISGSDNVFSANHRGDVCPPELEFLATAEGGELDLCPPSDS